MKENTKVRVRDLNINYGDFVLMKNLNFVITVIIVDGLGIGIG